MPEGRRDGFVPRVLAYHASRDLVPLYSVYALLFADHGVSSAQISLLFIIWSLTSFVCEVPSGAWADTFDRRRLLVLSAAIYAVGFGSWTVWQSFAGFAFGFVCWGFSSALMSGTFESLVYDELVERRVEGRYAELIGWAQSTALVANLTATAAAAYLFHVGGYALVGWTSVVIAVGQGALAATLPVSARARRVRDRDEGADGADGTDGPDGAEGGALAGTERAASTYVAMLRAGLSESRHHPDVRRVLLLAATMVGLTAYDEYFPLVARDHGVATSTVPLLIAITVVGQVVGTALVGRTARFGGPVVGGVLGAGAVLVSVGALASPYLGFVAIAVGYGMLNNAMLVGETRLQDAITGPARATVTSVLGLIEELVALAVYGAFSLGSQVLDFPTLVALLGVPTVLVAVAVVRWLPDRAQRGLEDSSVGVPES
ncbi:MAG TPA: MFS transporter [Nocardioides sp.]|jgi:MFS family permease|nr:MFS transporter [Nocardioides sp.]